MRLNSRNQSLGEIPEVDITPMLNVIMVVLAFFVIVSTTLSSPPSELPLGLPAADEDDAPLDRDRSIVLRVQLQADGTLLVDENQTTLNSVLARLPEFLQNNPDSAVVLIPGSEAEYQLVLQVFAKLQAICGDRVSLAIGATQEGA